MRTFKKMRLPFSFQWNSPHGGKVWIIFSDRAGNNFRMFIPLEISL